MLSVTALESRYCPASVLLASAGGVVYERVGGGWEVRVRAFESDVPATLARVGDSVYVGAGVGGAPRVVEYGRGWQVLSSVFVGDPESRSGVSVLGFEGAVEEKFRSVQYLTGETPAVRQYLDLVPALNPDLSRVSVRVVSESDWDRPLTTSAYYLGTGDNPVSGVLVIREGQEYFAVHELGHFIDHLTGGLKTRTPAEAESYAWAFHRWVYDGEPNPVFDALLAA